MTEVIVQFFDKFIDNEYVLLFVLSIIPITDMRGAVLLSGGMNINHFLAFLSCLAGSSVVILPLLGLFRPVMKWLRMTRLFRPLADLVENAVKEKAVNIRDEASHGKIKNAAYWALFAFVAFPLPLTGVWMGSAIAAFIGLKFWKSAAVIFVGNIVACGVLSLLVWVAKPYIDVIILVFLAICVLILLLTFAKKWQKKMMSRNIAVNEVYANMTKESMADKTAEQGAILAAQTATQDNLAIEQGVTVRKALSADRLAIASCIANGFSREFSVFGNSPESVAGAIADGLDLGRFFVAEKSGEVIGVTALSDCHGRAAAVDGGAYKKHFGVAVGYLAAALLKKEFETPLEFPETVGYIEFVSVNADYRRKGVASALIGEVTRSDYYTDYILDVIDTNEAAISLYKKMGFREIRREKATHLIKTHATEKIYMMLSKPE